MLFELQSDSAQSTASLEDYLEALRKRKYLALGFTCFGLLAGFGFANRQPTIYEAGARVLVNPTRVGSSNNSLVTPRPDREVAVLQGDETSKAAIDAASKQVPGASGSISVSFRPDSDAIGLVASSTNPQYSAALANAYVNTYVSRRVRDQQKFYDVSIESSNAEITQFQKRIAEAEARATDLDVRRGEIAKVAGGTSTQEYQSLSTTRDAIKQQVGSDYNSVRAAEQRVNELNRERSIQLPAASIVSSARVPDSPSGLPKWAYWFAGGFVGAILGTVAAFLRQRLDRSAQASSEVELALGSQVLGGVPAFGWRFRSGTSALVMANARPPRSIQRAQEAYRRLRGALMFLQRAGEARSIVFTSNHPMEGKSTTAANVALAVASGGSRVVLISADLRKPSLERLVGIDNSYGLSSYLLGTNEFVRREPVPGFPTMTLIPAGPQPTNPGELLSGRRFANLVAELKHEFDLVIIDTPPLGAAADALAAANAADGVVVVVDGQRTRTTELLAIRNQLNRSGHKLLGAVLNRDAAQRHNLFQRRKAGYGYYLSGRGTEAVSTWPDPRGGDGSPTGAFVDIGS